MDGTSLNTEECNLMKCVSCQYTSNIKNLIEKTHMKVTLQQASIVYVLEQFQTATNTKL